MALFPAGFMKTIVSLGKSEDSFTHVGTGFLYHHPLRVENGTTHYRPYLVTNKHVIDAGPTDIRFNDPGSGSLVVHPICSVTEQDWTTHSNGEDVAVIPLQSPGPLTLGRRVMDSEIFLGDIGTPSDQEWSTITEGTGVFLIGFPLGLVGDGHNYPIVRSGIIARIQDWLGGASKTFLIDAPAFPGNSGGPVIIRPDHAAVSGTTPLTHALLIGVVSENISSREVAISPQTGEPRIVFIENTGLSRVVPINAVKETLTAAVSLGS